MEPQINRSMAGVFSVLFVLGSLATAAAAAPAEFSDDRPGKGRAVPGRRITITRTGYGQARPNAATIDLPFAVEGEDWPAVEKLRDLLIASLEKELLPCGSAATGVSIFSGQSGQAYRDGKAFTTDSGTLRIYVYDLSRWKEVLTTLSRRSEALTLRYQATEVESYWKAQDQAQKNAVALARQGADRLAGLAGTRVIGVLEICEGVSKSEEPLQHRFDKHVNAIPQEVALTSAEITITFELAPPVSNPPAFRPKQKVSKKVGR